MKNPLGKKGYWRMSDGTEIKISKMNHGHLKNAACMVDRFIDHQQNLCIDRTEWPGQVDNPFGLFALLPFKEKLKELEAAL